VHALADFGVRVLETMFFLGIVGSALVLVLTAIEGIRTLLNSKNGAGETTPS
jgi:hypothetical protein